MELSLPFEAENRIRQQLRVAQPPTNTADNAQDIQNYVQSLGEVLTQCRAAAGGSELAAIELFKATIHHFHM